MNRRTTALRVLTATLLALGLLGPGGARAERVAEDRFFYLGAEEGLEGRILDIVQDPTGFLWFAGPNGIFRYDGSAVRSFPVGRRGGSAGLTRRLLIDSGGTLWVATGHRELFRWLPEEERFDRLNLDLGGEPVDLVEPAPGRLLISLLSSGILEVQTEARSAASVPSLAAVDCVAVDAQRQALWGFGPDGLARHAPDGTFDPQLVVPFPPAFEVVAGGFLECIVTRDGSVWGAAYLSGAIRYRPETGQLTVFQHVTGDSRTLTGNDLTTVFEDSRGELWIAGFSGLNRLVPESDTFHRFVFSPLNDRSLANDQLHAIFEDRTGQLWLGSDFGAARFDPLRGQFLFYAHDPTREASIPAGSIRSFAEDEAGRLWVGSRNHGVARIDRDTGETLYYPADPQRDGLADKTAWALHYEAPGRLWVATEAGVSRLEVDSDAWRSFTFARQVEGQRILTLHRDRRGTLWIGGDPGLYRHDPVADAFDLVPIGEEAREMDLTDSEWRVLALSEDSKGRLFVGLHKGGLVVLDLEDGRRLRELTPEPLADASITVLVTTPGPSETTWVATLTGGLHRLERDGTWTFFGPDRGLPAEPILALEAEADGVLWFSTGLETYRYDPRTGARFSFRPEDGLPAMVHDRASLRGRDGTLFFGGLDGFTAILPDEFQIDAAPPAVVLTDFQIGTRSIRPRALDEDSPLETSITFADAVTLEHFQNDFSIELAALHFGNPERNRFAYRMDGVDSDWIEVSAERSFARYSGIPAGRYVFRAKAANRDGVWSENEARLEIRVRPAPWRSWWALTLYIFAAAGLVTFWMRTKTERLKLEKELQEKELKILRGLLPICASCKKIRDDEGEWEPFESYLDTRSEAKFSHGICPECSAHFFDER